MTLHMSIPCICDSWHAVWLSRSINLDDNQSDIILQWWRHKMETFSASLAICAGNSPGPCEFPVQRPVTRSFHVFFDLRLNKPLSKQSWGWWFETLSCPLRRHCNAIGRRRIIKAMSFVCDPILIPRISANNLNKLNCITAGSIRLWAFVASSRLYFGEFSDC